MKKSEKRLSIIIISCILFQIIFSGLFSCYTVLADTGFRHEALPGGEAVLGGNYIEVGISKSGSFGTNNQAPTEFHNIYPWVGLRVDGDGFDIGNDLTTGDFFLPDIPEESFTVGYKAGSETALPAVYTNAERMGETDIDTATTDSSAGDTLSALTDGVTADGNLKIQQKISFKVNDKFFKNKITYTNNGADTLYDVRYMRSINPDQDYDLNGELSTYNCVLENFPQDSRAIVRASGAVTKEPIFFISMDSRARASAFGLLNRNPYDINTYNEDGSLLKAPEALEDQSIAITFALGNLSPGQSVTFEYYTSLDPDYEAGLAAIMGSIGIMIDNGAAETFCQNVTLNLNGVNATQMQFSNDNAAWSPWEDYTPEKAWTLTPGEGEKTVYVHFKDDSGNITATSDSINYIPDNSAPVFSVSGNPESWTIASVILTVSASDTGSGLDPEGAYSFDGGLTWQTSDTQSFPSNTTAEIKVRDKSGNISSQNIVIDKIDKTAPVISGITQTAETWTKDSVTLTVNAKDEVSGLEAEAYSFDGGLTWQSSNTKIYDSNVNGIAVKVRDNAGNVSEGGPIDITNIDKSQPNAPVIADSENYTDSKWYSSDQKITAVFTKTEGCSERLEYRIDDSAWTEGDTADVNTEGKHDVGFRVIDAIGRSSEAATVKVNIDKTKPQIIGASNSEWYYIGRTIRITDNSGEFAQVVYKNGTGPETSFNSGDLFYEPGIYTLKVTDKAGNSSSISFEIKAIPNYTDIAYNFESKQLIEYLNFEFSLNNDLPGIYRSEIRTKIYKLEMEYDRLHREATAVSDYIRRIKKDLQIRQEDEIKGELSYIESLSKEQQDSLKFEIESLKNMLDRINVLKEQVRIVEKMINSIPAADKITKQDFKNITNTNAYFSMLTEEQKILLGRELINKLLDSLEAMYHDKKTDVTVTGFDGTSLPSGAFLIVTPITGDTDSAEFEKASKELVNAAEYEKELEGKELMALYDIALRRDNLEIEPDGKVKVKIRIPESLKDCTGLDIVHIADNGTVTVMNAKIEDGYLVFITDHFSNYAIIANPKIKAIPKTGDIFDFGLLILIGGILMAIGATQVTCHKSFLHKK